MPNIIKAQNEEQFNDIGAGIVASLLQSNPKALLGLATGSSPVGVYGRLVELYKEGSVSFAQAQSYNLDEYVGLPSDHPESYRRFMNEKLFNLVDILPENTHVPMGSSPDPEKAAAEYTELLQQAGRLDLQILGVGLNGHIGFNEPASELHGFTHVVTLDESTRQANARFFSSIDEVPTQAITMGIASILHAKQILLLVRGAEKAEVISRALNGPVTTHCPASLLQTHPNVIVLVDQEAGRLL
ncbi:glucosamine-6-phosphate deaminase [Paenibacillus physcomitrellae]|uniref:Glucosamine-6-phosphate deaminase n=1 Tax=Paenibacillus physcomitrellae TaxID=1619311 RepID=A0ABQ1G399_9BACL|nr:glucosamine-6-phosphate deaminase [Paenibacillus physcomitrellae]GGA36012.1 glucosamine-6-phosphate deaminase [Paenibacillus physcomitrellae]